MWSYSTVAQVNDAGLWTGISIEKKWNKRWKTEFELETRYNENWAELESSFIDASTEYELSDYLDVSLNYRFGNKIREDNSYSLRQRLSLDLSTKWEIGKLDMSYRMRFQRNQQGLGINEGEMDFNNGWRNKLGADIKIFKKTRMEGSTELFTSEDEEGYYISDIRYAMGVEYRIKKRRYIELGFLHQRQLQENDPLREWVMTVSLKLEFK